MQMEINCMTDFKYTAQGGSLDSCHLSSCHSVSILLVQMGNKQGFNIKTDSNSRTPGHQGIFGDV